MSFRKSSFEDFLKKETERKNVYLYKNKDDDDFYFYTHSPPKKILDVKLIREVDEKLKKTKITGMMGSKKTVEEVNERMKDLKLRCIT